MNLKNKIDRDTAALLSRHMSKKDSRNILGLTDEEITGPDDNSAIGRTIYSSDFKIKGTITNIVRRYCAGCQCYTDAYSVKWEDGSRTYPCSSGCEETNGMLHIG